MSHHVNESTPPMDFREGGKIKTDFKTMLAIIAFAIAVGGAYWTLQDHTKRLDRVENTLDAQHDLLLQIKNSVDRKP